MTGDAGNSVVIEGPLHVRVFCKRACKQRCRVMARFAVTSELDSLLSLNVLNIFLIERFAKGVTVCRLPPLRMRVCVTNATTLGRHKHIARNEGAGRRAGVAGSKRVGTELEVVGF